MVQAVETSLRTLSRVTAHMLRAETVDDALHAMLSGLTADLGLGFNRAALFGLDDRGVLRGLRALGPADEGEAHRTWEEMVAAPLSLDDLVAGAERVDPRLQAIVQSMVLAQASGEVRDALGPTPTLRYRGPCLSRSLAPLEPADERVLAPISARGRTLGLLYADNRYTRRPIDDDDLDLLRCFLDSTALAWENLSLLRRVEALAREDSLTGLLSRGELERRFGEEAARAQRSGGVLSVLLIDVDHFKRINDTRGHTAGDAVLRELGAILRHALRGPDLVGRFGGDEFLVLLPSTTREQARAAAGRIGSLALASGISLSIGAACWPADCPAPSHLIEAADANLYRAKRAGRGRACLSAGEHPVPHD
jgi:diguanylate cyclase (GGDEF)-like protein